MSEAKAQTGSTECLVCGGSKWVARSEHGVLVPVDMPPTDDPTNATLCPNCSKEEPVSGE